MKKDIRVAAVQTTVPKTTKEGEKQIERLIKETITQPVDLIGLTEDCLATYDDVRNGYNPFIFLSEMAKNMRSRCLVQM